MLWGEVVSSPARAYVFQGVLWEIFQPQTMPRRGRVWLDSCAVLAPSGAGGGRAGMTKQLISFFGVGVGGHVRFSIFA
jgi:hypothetical protein